MNAISKNKKIYVIRYSDWHFVSNDILSYGEDLIEHIAVTKGLPDSYSFINTNGSLPRDLLQETQQINGNPIRQNKSRPFSHY